MYIRRHLETEIGKASRSYPVVMVCGQRQVGKSTMLYNLKGENRRYISLDDASARRLAESDPELFLDTYRAPLIIDEFQRVPGILIEIKKRIDCLALKGIDNTGMYWLTGSQKFKMMRDVSESLAGRVAVFDMSGLSSSEISGISGQLFTPDIDLLRSRLEEAPSMDITEAFSRIFKGGMPKLYSSEIERDRYYMDYVATYLERDIRDLAQVEKLSEFHDFLVFMAARTSQEVKYNEIASAIGISAPTAKAWVSLLEKSGILFILRPYHSNLTSRLVKTPKFYFMDTGLAAYLCRWPNAETLMNGPMDGAFFETWVVSEIVKSCFNTGKEPDMYFYRDTEKREIDLLMVRNGRFFPIEIKKSRNPSNPDRNFNVLEKFGPVGPGIILCPTEELLPLNRHTWLCPVAAL